MARVGRGTSEPGAVGDPPAEVFAAVVGLVPRTEAVNYGTAARTRFEVETRGVGFAESQILLGALAALRELVPLLALETIARLTERLRVNFVAL